MSVLFRSTSRLAATATAAARPRPTTLAIAIAPSRRAFAAFATRYSKESDLGNADNAEQSERHKEDSLKKQKDGKGHWKAELASDSEEAVTADRHEYDDHKTESMEELQKRTIQHAEKKHRTGTSQDPGM